MKNKKIGSSRPHGRIIHTRQLKNWKAEAPLSLSVSWNTARQNSSWASSSFVDAMPSLVQSRPHAFRKKVCIYIYIYEGGGKGRNERCVV